MEERGCGVCILCLSEYTGTARILVKPSLKMKADAAVWIVSKLEDMGGKVAEEATLEINS